MKRNFLQLSLLLACSLSLQAQQYLVSGCGYNKIAIIDQTGKILWDAPVETNDCNDAEETTEGNILYAYKHGARLINRAKETIWDFKVSYPQEEVFTATQLPDGNYLVACCGRPARILELNAQGTVVHELKYDTGLEKIHSQFRQILKTKRDTYLIPLMAKGVIREIDLQGNLIREVKVGGNLFQVQELDNGNWLASCGDAHCLREVDPQTGKIVEEINNDKLEGVELKFVSETLRKDNGNTLFSNWAGHDRGGTPSAMIFELDKDLQVVWQLPESKELRRISTISEIKKAIK